MDIYLSIDYWLFEPHFWLIVGLLLIIADIFLASFFLLPIGVSAIIMAALIYFEHQHFIDVGLFSSWRGVLVSFAALSVLSIFIIQSFVRIRRKDHKDINQY